MKDKTIKTKFKNAIEVHVQPLYKIYDTLEAAKACNTLHQQALKEERKKTEEAVDFAYKLSKGMLEISSSHVYFIMQQSFEHGEEMSWEDCVQKWERIIGAVENIKKTPYKKRLEK